MRHKAIMTYAVLAIAGIMLAACAPKQNYTQPVVQPELVDIPIAASMQAPVELKRSPVALRSLPVFTSPATPGVTSCLVPAEESNLRLLLDSREGLLDGWERFGYAQ